jgi:hypothetical protein
MLIGITGDGGGGGQSSLNPVSSAGDDVLDTPNGDRSDDD